MRQVRGDLLIYGLAALPAVVIALLVLIAIMAGAAPTGALANTMPQPAPVGP